MVLSTRKRLVPRGSAPRFVAGLIAVIGAHSLSVSTAKAELYGIGHGISADTFYQIDTSTGAATPLFSFGNAGTTLTYALTYDPVSNKYLTVQATGLTQTALIEIDAVTQTAAAVAHGIPGTAFEGIEYMPSLGGTVVSYGNSTTATGKLALLNSSYSLINNNPSTGITDGDTLFLDSTGALNLLDSNNPYGGWQRNTITNPFGAISINVNGASNPFTGTDFDLAWKADEAKLFLTRQTSLARIVGPNNIFSVGSYGSGIQITGIAVGPPIPEPTVISAFGAAALFVRRRR
jgi:hypothetical protein